MAVLSPEEIRNLLPDFVEILKGKQKVAIGTHLNPDGDALGSALAVHQFLRQMGIQSEVLCHHEPPPNLRFLPGAEDVHTHPHSQDYDAAVVVDLDALDRLGSLRPLFESIQPLVLIDHHIPVESPGDLRIISTKSPATAAILCDLFFDSDFEITPLIADLLLTGILTDTGCFRYPNTTAHSLKLVASLLEAGASLPRVNEEVYMSRSLASVQIQGHAMSHLKLASEGGIAWVTLTNDVFNSVQATDEDTEGLVNELLAVSTVRIAGLLRESKPGKIRVSLRSRGDFDVAQVASLFGGGGHKNAAGCAFDIDMQSAEEQLVEALIRCLESS
ncbi:MAG: bifunctional oligoribonuclease/PAP phosphatase NrnA [Fimbriimonadaceae bacterium]|nr:bifunctional oligoribonuclease/PAP phosphatase NrnA [Fimbriimonadaceae bacterium]